MGAERRVFSEEEMIQMRCERHTEEVEGILRRSCAAVCGLGGLGSHIAFFLARAGVGKLILIDFDTVELSNLNRQEYRAGHVGMPKTEALAGQLEEINPYIKTEKHRLELNEENATGILRGADVVCEAFDRPEAKAMLVETVLTGLPGTYLIASSGMAGFESSNSILTEKISEYFYLCGDRVSGIEDGSSLMAPRVAVCAGHEANMALRILLDRKEV